MTYYRIGLLDIVAIMLTKGFWLLWVIWRADKIDIPEEPEA